MSPRTIHFMPIVGFVKYFREYFKAEKRDAVEALKATYMQAYHFIITLILIGPPILWLFGKL